MFLVSNSKKVSLSVRGISKTFGSVKALTNISFDLYQDEIVGLVGGNSAGKTTLVKILSGNLQPDSGEINFNGKNITFENTDSLIAAGIETVHQGCSLCDNLDVTANLFLGHEITKTVMGIKILDSAEMEKQAAEVFRILKCNIPCRAKLTDLSGGHRQMIALGRFLLWGEQLVLLDEPMTALSLEQTRTVLEQIKLVNQNRKGSTILMISHNLKNIFEVADRIIVLRQGKIIDVRNTRDTTEDEILNLITGDVKDREANLRTILDSIGDAVIATDLDSVITRMNPVAEELTGWKYEYTKSIKLPEVFHIIDSTTKDVIDNPAIQIIENDDSKNLINENAILIAKDGTEYQITYSCSCIFNDFKEKIGTVSVFRDVTKQMNLQEQLNQSRKMDAIGQLAGGVAHDFNNMLSGIIGATELLKIEENYTAETKDNYLNIILTSAERAAELTAKLTAFGRKGNNDSIALDIHSVIEDTIAILKQTIDKKISLKKTLGAKNVIVSGNYTGLQNAFLNLCINACHAMPDGGKLNVSTENLYLDKVYCDASIFDLEPGDYIEIAITDTGRGIPQDIIGKIFEPFFTTKEVGKGTGLGLAAVYGMIQDHKGAINVYSEENIGTVFHLFLPLSKSEKLSDNSCLEIDVPANHDSGTILIVDDEDIIRITGKAILEEAGYTVLLAEDGLDGLNVLKKHKDEIDLVILDMVMPKMNGREVFYKMRSLKPDCAILIASGFTKDENLNELKENGLAGFIAKPFRGKILKNEVSRILN
jgi:PAS domain S-box-containing protein